MSTRFRSGIVIAAVTFVLVGRAVALQQPPSRSYQDYVLIGLTSVRLSGVAHVASGGVGVDVFGSNGTGLGFPGTFYLSHYGKFDGTAAPVANVVRLSNQTHVGQVFANHFFPASDVVFGTVHTFDAAPGNKVFTTLPGFPPFDCPSSSATGALVLGHDTHQSIAPGTYTQLFMRDDSQITLAPGTYQFDDIRLGKRCKLTTTGPTTIRVCGNVRLSNGASLVSGTSTAKDLVLWVAGPRVVLSHNDVVIATLRAPHAHLQLGGPTTLRGQFLADVVTSDSRVDLTCDAGGAGCDVNSTSTTTTIPGGGGGSTTTTLPGGGGSTTTTLPGGHGTTTTTVPGGRGTTTTTTPGGGKGTTTTTLPSGNLVPKEICGNCLDDDGDGLTDFEDPDCCQQQQAFTMSLSRGRIRARGTTSYLRIKSLLAAAGLSSVDPYHQDVFLQIRPAGGKDVLCAHAPAKYFMKMHGDPKFWDRKHSVPTAQGIDDLTVHIAKNGRVFFRTLGRHVRFAAPGHGQLEVTVGFRNMTLDQTDRSTNRCSRVTQSFKTGPRGALIAP